MYSKLKYILDPFKSSLLGTLLTSLALGLITAYCSVDADAQGLTISGIVTVDKTPISGASLYISGSNKRFYSRSGGLYKITVPGGSSTYTISVLPTSRFVALPISKTIEVGSESIANFNFDLTKTPAGQSVIYGRVTARSQPLEGVTVRVSSLGNMLTDKNGVYSFDKLKAGRYYLATSVTGYTFSSSLRRVLLKSDKLARVDLSGRQIPSGATYMTNFPGLYDFTANTKDTTCQLQKQNLTGIASISQINDRVTIRLPTLGNFSGKVQGSMFTLSVNKIKNFCRLKGSITGDFPQIDKGSIQGSSTITCFGQPACTLNFTGNLSRR